MLNSENIYSIWISLYVDYHFKGSTAPLNIVGIERKGFNAFLPFFDMRLAKFFMKIPEDWGRGLNWNHIKYPQKTIAFNSKTYPLHIVNRKTTHSYIIEIDPTINDDYEYYSNSTIGDYLRDFLSEKGSLDYLINLKGINSDYLSKIKNDFLNEKSQAKDLSVAIKICFLTSIMKEYLSEDYNELLLLH